MALTKSSSSVAMTWASGSATASGTTNAVDVSDCYAAEVHVQIVVVGTASTAASFVVQFSIDNSNYRSQFGPYAAGTAAATYRFPPIPIPPGVNSVQLVYTAQSGGTSSTLTADVSQLTAI